MKYLDESDHFDKALGDICDAYPAFRPPQNILVSQSAIGNLVSSAPGLQPKPWDQTETPYMLEPMDMLGSRLHDSVIFAGPARTGKTFALLLGWMAHAVISDPGDMLMIQMTQDKAREFSKVDLSRALDNSPSIRRMLSASASDRNTHDVQFRHGMWLRIAWPTVQNVSSSTYRYTAVTDYDRIKGREDMDGEGNLFRLMVKRTQTFLSRGMSLAESSPGEPVVDPFWKPSQMHEAPPLRGILGLYNLSDRRRWYWKCMDCADWFEAAPGLGLFRLPSDIELLQEIGDMNIRAFAKDHSRVICPHCGSMIDFRHRHEMNMGGRWLAAGQYFDGDTIVGAPMATTSVGYWLGGVAAAYQKWESLILNHLNALKEYALNGSEETLKQTINTDQGMPYTPMHLLEAGGGKRTPLERAEALPRRFVPPETRCLTASVDVQGGSNARFVVQVHAVGPLREQWLVDRFELRDSKREGVDGGVAPIDPASHPEDWDVLIDKVIMATYPTGVTGKEIRVMRTVIDTGGEEGVSDNAYSFYRRLRARHLSARVILYKGASNPNAPIIKQTMVGKRGGANDKPDIPLYVCQPNLLSDIVDAGLRRQSPGAGYIHFPKPKHQVNNPEGWLPQAFFDELHAEVRQDNGTWMQVRKRNESFDLCRMMAALHLQMGLNKIVDWNVVPQWLAPLDQNSEVISVEDRRVMQAEAMVISEQVKVRRPPHLFRRPRRSIPSPYLS